MNHNTFPSSVKRPYLITSIETTNTGTHITINVLPKIPRPRNTIRIVFQNCNGISPTKIELSSTLSTINNLEPSAIGLAETNVDWNQHSKATKPFMQSVKALWPHKKSITSCADESQHSPTAYQPGGCAQISINNLAPRHRSKSKDHTGMGRWTVQHFKGQDTAGLVIYTVYRVSQTTASGLGVKTAFLQQQRVLNRAGVIGPNPKEQVLIELTLEINANRNNGYDILVLMDANSSINDRHLSSFLQNTSLQDLLHHDSLDIQTRWPGTKRIDFMFGTRRIAESVKSIGYLPWNCPLVSDHLGLYLDIDETKIFGKNILDPAQLSSRRLRSTAPQRRARYLTHLMKCVTSNNLHQRLLRLHEKCQHTQKISSRDKQTYQNIDRELTKYMLSAERQCCHSQTKYSSSDILSKTGTKVRLLKNTIRHLKGLIKENKQSTT